MSELKHEASLKRLSKIEGQVRGVMKMMEQDRYCIEILQQIQAVKAAITKVESMVLKEHAAHCVAQALDSGDIEDQRTKFSELVDLFERTRR